MKETRTRDGAGTQAKILAAAEKLFSEHGFSGTSIGKISKASSISDGLILHHYKTKDNLYRAVRERVANRYHLVLEERAGLGLFEDDFGDMVLQLFHTAFDHFKKNRSYHRISLWSYLEGKNDTVEKEAAITGEVADLVRAGQEEGILADDFDPVTLLTMTVGSIHYWMRYRNQFKKMLGYTESLSELDKRFQAQAAMLLKRCAVRKVGQ